jgi:rhodanese-related sulfurtransferase
MSYQSVQNIDPRTAKEWLDAGEAVMIDIREPNEHALERIPGVPLNPMSRFDPAAIVREPGQRIVLQCRSGARSMNLALQLAAAGIGPCYNLEGGIIRWKRDGLPVEGAAAMPGGGEPAPGRPWWPFR